MVNNNSNPLPPNGEDDGDDTVAVTYEELAEVERKFEDVDVWIMRQNCILTEPIYVKRAQLIRRIPNFWAIVMEEAPEEIDHRIQPCDTAALSTLQSIELTRFEVSESAPHAGDPRSVKISFTFVENAWFTDKVLEKTFWHRRARDGWTGLVSEPVRISWKEGKDLTEGMLSQAVQIFQLENSIERTQGTIGNSVQSHSQEEGSILHQQLGSKLIKKLEETPQDALSFFAWFGYRGRNVSAEESTEAINREKQKRKRLSSGDGALSEDSSDIEDDDTEKDGLEYEIYPAGEDLAIAISEDLFPGAIKYFIQSLKEDQLDSDVEVELESSGHSDSKDSLDSDEPAMKKQKTIA